MESQYCMTLKDTHFCHFLLARLKKYRRNSSFTLTICLYLVDSNFQSCAIQKQCTQNTQVKPSSDLQNHWTTYCQLLQAHFRPMT